MRNEAFGAFFVLLGSLLYTQPKKEVLEKIADDGLFDDLPLRNPPVRIGRAAQLMSAWLKSAPPAELASQAQSDYLSVLQGVGDRTALPWASTYLEKDGLLFGEETLRVRRKFAQHKQELVNKYREPDDHIGLELEFIGQLLENGESDEASSFADKHVAPWVETWNKDVQTRAACPYYKALAELAASGIESML